MPVFNAEKGIQDWTEIPPDTVKIVLGPSPGSDEDDDAPFRLPPPPEDFAAQFPQLTHLYIWSAKELDALPPFPEALRVLDLRGCSGLRKLPDLPERLEELDLGECSSLEELPEAPVALQRLFFNQCDALEDDELQPFLKRLRKSGAPLVEIDASGSRLTKFTNIPRDALRKLVAKDCPELKDIRAVSEFEALQHLNLSGCGEIVSLPKIPATLQYLALSGAENLHDFWG